LIVENSKMSSFPDPEEITGAEPEPPHLTPVNVATNVPPFVTSNWKLMCFPDVRPDGNVYVQFAELVTVCTFPVDKSIATAVPELPIAFVFSSPP
jgi:hypothetical protein